MLVFIDNRKGIKIQIFNIYRSGGEFQIQFSTEEPEEPFQLNRVYEETDGSNKQTVRL